MIDVELGFVSICLSEKDCSPAGSVTVKQIGQLDDEAARARVLRTARTNLEKTLRIMRFLCAHDIRLYRISAMLIPLATHERMDGWDWWNEPDLVELGERIGAAARDNRYRLSSHLPELCGLSSEALFKWTRRYGEYHRRLFELLELDESVPIILHVGGAGGDKERALSLAARNLEQMDPWLRRRIALENDDRTFTLTDVLGLAERSGVKVVFDWHHHVVNPPEEGAGDRSAVASMICRSAMTWRDRPFKVHVSSPRSQDKVRAHADYVDPGFVDPLFGLLADAPIAACDVMVEAKMKDLALFRLREALQRTNEVNV